MPSASIYSNRDILPFSQSNSALAAVTHTDILSCRQLQILAMIADDLTSNQMACGLGLSVKTIEFHRQNIKQRLGVKGIAGMVRYAIRTGLLEP